MTLTPKSKCSKNRAQATLADSRNAVFDGPNTDRDVTPLDRYDGYHFGASGQEKFTGAWMRLLQEREAMSPSLNPH